MEPDAFFACTEILGACVEASSENVGDGVLLEDDSKSLHVDDSGSKQRSSIYPPNTIYGGLDVSANPAVSLQDHSTDVSANPAVPGALYATITVQKYSSDGEAMVGPDSITIASNTGAYSGPSSTKLQKIGSYVVQSRVSHTLPAKSQRQTWKYLQVNNRGSNVHVVIPVQFDPKLISTNGVHVIDEELQILNQMRSIKRQPENVLMDCISHDHVYSRDSKTVTKGRGLRKPVESSVITEIESQTCDKYSHGNETDIGTDTLSTEINVEVSGENRHSVDDIKHDSTCRCWRHNADACLDDTVNQENRLASTAHVSEAHEESVKVSIEDMSMVVGSNDSVITTGELPKMQPRMVMRDGEVYMIKNDDVEFLSNGETCRGTTTDESFTNPTPRLDGVSRRVIDEDGDVNVASASDVHFTELLDSLLNEASVVCKYDFGEHRKRPAMRRSPHKKRRHDISIQNNASASRSPTEIPIKFVSERVVPVKPVGSFKDHVMSFDKNGGEIEKTSTEILTNCMEEGSDLLKSVKCKIDEPIFANISKSKDGYGTRTDRVTCCGTNTEALMEDKVLLESESASRYMSIRNGKVCTVMPVDFNPGVFSCPGQLTEPSSSVKGKDGTACIVTSDVSRRRKSGHTRTPGNQQRMRKRPVHIPLWKEVQEEQPELPDPIALRILREGEHSAECECKYGDGDAKNHVFVYNTENLISTEVMRICLKERSEPLTCFPDIKEEP